MTSTCSFEGIESNNFSVDVCFSNCFCLYVKYNSCMDLIFCGNTWFVCVFVYGVLSSRIPTTKKKRDDQKTYVRNDLSGFLINLRFECGQFVYIFTIFFFFSSSLWHFSILFVFFVLFEFGFDSSVCFFRVFETFELSTFETSETSHTFSLDR